MALPLLFGFTLVFAACERPASDTGEADPSAGEADATHQDDGHAAHGEGPAHDALPLRPIMQLLGSNMAGFTQAMWLEDYEQMAAYAEGIADHPHISGEEMERIQAELGQELDRFVAADEAVHDASVGLHQAVEARDMDRILGRLNEVQVGCMACHTRFRARLRTDLTAP